MIQQWAERENHLLAAKVFRIGILLWLALHSLLLLPFHATIWGPEAYALRLSFDGSWYSWLFQLALHPQLKSYYLAFVFLQLAAIALGVWGYKPRLMLLIVFFMTMNINNLTGVVLDGGNNLSQLLLVYLILVNTSGRPVQAGSAAPWLRAVSNAAFLLCQLQVAIVYLNAGLLKANGHLWQNGMALYYIFQSETYGHPFIAGLMRKIPELSLLGTYVTLIFQYFFPSFIWLRRWRLPLIAVGLMLHLGIAFGMGLFTFGLVMCVAYLLFLPEEWAAKILSFAPTRQPIRVAYDERCGLCQRFAKIIQSLDWQRRIQGDGAHNPNDPRLDAIPLDVRLHSLQAIAAGQVFQGFASISEIFRRVPLLFPFLPLMLLADVSGWGERFYRRLALGSWRQPCRDGVCRTA